MYEAYSTCTVSLRHSLNKLSLIVLSTDKKTSNKIEFIDFNSTFYKLFCSPKICFSFHVRFA